MFFSTSHLPPAVLLLALVLPPGCGDKDDEDTSDTSDTGADTTVTPRNVVHVTDDIAADTTWTDENLYVVDNAIAVTATLTLAGDPHVKLAPGASIKVNEGGAILAQAAEPGSCVFTSFADDTVDGDTNGDGGATAPAPGDWNSIEVSASGSVFDGCQFLYGGGGMPYTGTVAVLGDSSITVTNCTFAHDQGGNPSDIRAAAFNASGAAAPTIFTGNTFFDDDLPVVVNGTFSVDDSNVFDQGGVSNLYNGIFWGGSETSGDVAWTNVRVPFVVVSGDYLAVAKGSSLTLGDGVILKFDDGMRLEASGALLADADTGIVFTSFKDDSVGGDTNGDGSASSVAPGDWRGVGILADGSLLHGCQFLYGGSAAPYSGVVNVHDSVATLTDNVFAHNTGGTPEDNRAAALGLADAEAGTIVTGNVFYDNDMPLTINGAIDVDGSNVFHQGGESNLYNGIFLQFTSHVVDRATAWSNTEVAYVAKGMTLSVSETGSLTLGDDVVVKVEGGSIMLESTLNQGDNVWFTSFLDDTLAGDTNGDGAGSTPARGDWMGVNVCLGSCEWADWGNILYADHP
jgi:hypothetical protein